MGSICKFYEDDANVSRHGNDHFSEIFSLSLFPRLEVNFAYFCYAIDKDSDF